MTVQQSSSIPRTSSGSFLYFRPTSSRSPKKWPTEDEIIPDSEEERNNEKTARNPEGGGRESTAEDSDIYVLSASPTKTLHVSQKSVIVISSDSEEEGEVIQHKRSSSGSCDPFSAEPTRNKGKREARWPLPCIESDADSSVICISDRENGHTPSISPIRQHLNERTLTPYEPILDPDDPSNTDDKATLTFDPHLRAQPVSISRTPGSKSKSKRSASSSTKQPPSAPTTPRRPKPVPAKQLQLEAYARTLFAELNTTVFDTGLQLETELVWNKRLATTAGRAFWTRNRRGENSSKIELSPKVVDSEERVRNTLAHEMCHLAVWVLNNDPHEQGHGHKFKRWGARVMKARPDITISTRHTYEIDYRFKWECCVCGKIYGRHSKSIDPLKMGCGVCTPPGALRPLFETRPRRRPKATKSRLASSSPRESPRAIDPATRAPSKLAATISECEDEEVEELIKVLGRVDL